MKLSKLSLLILFISNIAFAQNINNDKEAVDLLNSVKKQMYAYEDMHFDFSYKMDNIEAGVNEKRSGNAFIKKEKFQLNLGEFKVIYDGNKRYTIADDEVTITSELDDSGISSPYDILNIYQDGYVIKMDIEQNDAVKKVKIQYIKLIPKDSNSMYKYILIGINKATKNLNNVIYTDTQGSEFKLEINNLKINSSLSDSYFSFDKSKYPEGEYFYTDLDE